MTNDNSFRSSAMIVSVSDITVDYPATKSIERTPISIICVFNDLAVRQRCLDRSIEEHRDEAPDVEYLPINNVDGVFPTAASALNYGASLASHDYLVFVHQDVYLHSLSALEEAAGILAGEYGVGMLGATGIASNGRLIGRIRDRVVLTGDPIKGMTVAESIDEVLFVAPRHLILREPLIDTSEFAWHGYAVEYGLRLRSLGLRVCVVDIPLTHNSLTVNLDRLDVAHAAIATSYPDVIPIRTTCGTVVRPKCQSLVSRILPSHRWRYRWLLGSIAARMAYRAAGGGLVVLSDIRQDIDEVLAVDLDPPLLVINLDHYPKFRDERPSLLELMRQGKQICFTSLTMPALIDVVAGRQPSISLLITNLTLADIKALAPKFQQNQYLIGYDKAINFWILLGPAASSMPERWQSRKAKPLGISIPLG